MIYINDIYQYISHEIPVVFPSPTFGWPRYLMGMNHKLDNSKGGEGSDIWVERDRGRDRDR